MSTLRLLFRRSGIARRHIVPLIAITLFVMGFAVLPPSQSVRALVNGGPTATDQSDPLQIGVTGTQMGENKGVQIDPRDNWYYFQLVVPQTATVHLNIYSIVNQTLATTFYEKSYHLYDSSNAEIPLTLTQDKCKSLGTNFVQECRWVFEANSLSSGVYLFALSNPPPSCLLTCTMRSWLTWDYKGTSAQRALPWLSTRYLEGWLAGGDTDWYKLDGLPGGSYWQFDMIGVEGSDFDAYVYEKLADGRAGKEIAKYTTNAYPETVSFGVPTSGSVLIKIVRHGLWTPGGEYYFSPLVSTVAPPVPQTCYKLTLKAKGSGDKPAASPTRSSSCNEGEYLQNEPITLSGYPVLGWEIKSWQGVTGISSGSNFTFNMPGQKTTVTVTYTKSCYALTRNTNDPLAGAVPVASPKNSSGCSAGQYNYKAKVTLTAKPNSGYAVQGWIGTNNDSSTKTINTITMLASAASVTVNYTPKLGAGCYTLTLNNSSGGGKPIASPSNSPRCSANQYRSGEFITLTAYPNTGWEVKGWSSSVTFTAVSGNTAAFVMPARNLKVGLNYGKKCYPLTVAVNGGGGTAPTVQPSSGSSCYPGYYSYQDYVTVTAHPNPGYHVIGWSGTDNNGSISVTNTTSMPDGPLTISVSYAPDVVCYTLNLGWNPPEGGSNLWPYPQQSFGCPAGQYTAGQQISVTAYPASGWQVGSWVGTVNNSSTSTTNTIVMPAGNHTVVVKYVQIPSSPPTTPPPTTPPPAPGGCVLSLTTACLTVEARDPYNVSVKVPGITVTFTRNDNGALIFSGITGPNGAVGPFSVPIWPVFYNYALSGYPDGSSCTDTHNSISTSGFINMWLQPPVPGGSGRCRYE